MNRAELKSLAKEQIKGSIWKLFLIFLVICLIAVPSGIFPMLKFEAGTTIYAYIIAGPLSIGLCRVYLGMSKGVKANFGTFFSGFKCFWKSLGLYLLVIIFTLLWTLLFIIPGIIKVYSYSQAFYILAENPEMSPLECIKESQRLMKGHKWEFFVLELSFILWSLLTSVTFGLAGIYVVPYMTMTFTNFYLALKANDNAETVVTVEA